MTPPLPDDQVAALQQLIFSRRKVEAIKLYRELTGLGLKESKDEIDRLESALKQSDPEKFSPALQANGCLRTVVFCLVVAAIVYWFVRRH